MCEYCTDNSKPLMDFYDRLIDGNMGLRSILAYNEDERYNLTSILEYRDRTIFINKVKINYCPMCGRKLSEQAVC